MPDDNIGDDGFNVNDNIDESIDDISWGDVSDDLESDKTGTKAGAVNAKSAKSSGSAQKFSELKKGGTVSMPQNLDFILDIPLQITVELGQTSMPIYDLLQLGQGSIIELNKLAGEPLEILVNQKLIAKGEVVVVNEKFGIRLTEVISTAERIENLG
jgi:flagellar motor switch protein FliN/FliY